MKLESDQNTFTYKEEHNIAIDSAKKEFLDDLQKYKELPVAHGIYSPEDPGSDAYVRVIKEEGGVFLKVYGCKYLYKGNSPRELVYALQFAKYITFQLPREMAKSVLYTLAIGLRFIFQRKKFLEDSFNILREINNRIRWYYDLPLIQQKVNEGNTNYFKVIKRKYTDYSCISLDEKFYNVFEKKIQCSGCWRFNRI